MNKIQLWQHPFVDVFKFMHIHDWKLCSKEGEVDETLDKLLTKKVLKITGAVCAANFIQIPKPKSSVKSLGLTGKYIYIQFYVPAGRLFSIHLDFIFKNAANSREELVRISLSNLFKENKAGATAQVSVRPSTRWTILCLDLPSIMGNLYAGKYCEHTLRSVTVCANIVIRGIYTSDIKYIPKTLPKEMMLRLGKDDRWGDLYDWIDLPDLGLGKEEQDFTGGELEENKQESKTEENKHIKKQTLRRNLQKEREKSKAEILKRGRSEERIRKPIVRPQSTKLNKENSRPKTATKPVEPSSTIPRSRTPEFMKAKPPAPYELTVHIESPPKAAKPKPPTNMLVPSSPPKPSVPQVLNIIQPESLTPDPILTLSSILGISAAKYTIQWLPISLFSNYDERLTSGCDFILGYSMCNSIILLNPTTKFQYILSGHSSAVTHILFHIESSLLISGQNNSCMILFWNLKSKKSPVPLMLKKIESIEQIFMNPVGDLMCSIGKDGLGRLLISVWEIKNILKRNSCRLVAQQLSTFEIKEAIWDLEDYMRIVTCGESNVKFWKIKTKSLASTAVPMQNFPPQQFSCICYSVSTAERRVYVGTESGVVFNINPSTKKVEAIYELNTPGILRILSINQLIVTSSSDFSVRIWGPHFEECFLEADHKARVIDMCCSGNSLACLTDSSTLGILGFTTGEYTSLIRGHSGPIHCYSLSPSTSQILTVSEDKTIRVWNPGCLEHSLEFSSTEEPLSCAFHPKDSIAAVGYINGMIRLFDLDEVSMKEEQCNHVCGVIRILFSNDSKVMISLGEDSSCYIYDTFRDYQVIKYIPVEIPGTIISADFSLDSSMFAILGSYGNSVNIWDTRSLSLKGKIKITGGFIQQVIFTPDGMQMILIIQAEVTKIMIYRIEYGKFKFEKEYKLDILVEYLGYSSNMKYSCIVSSDKLLRISDAEISKTPQAFLGHMNNLAITKFTNDMKSVYSLAHGERGIFVWNFLGDTQTLQASQEDLHPHEEIIQVPQITVQDQEVDTKDLEIEVSEYLKNVELIKTQSKPHRKPVLQHLLGCNTKHPDTLFWAYEEGWFIYPIGNTTIQTLLHGKKKQRFFQGHLDEVSVLALNFDSSLLATACRFASIEGTASIVIWRTDECEIIRSIDYHDRTVTSLAFSICGNYLVSTGNYEDSTVVVWEVATGRMVATSLLKCTCISAKWIPNKTALEFVTLEKDALNFWRLNAGRQLETQPIELEEGISNLSCMTFSPYIECILGHLLLVCTSDGSLCMWNTRTNSFLGARQVFNGRISCISSNLERLTLGGENPYLHSWEFKDGTIVGNPKVLLLDGYSTSLSFDHLGNEGLVATHKGTIWYINWLESATIRIVSGHVKEITSLYADSVIVTSAKDGTIRVWDETDQEQKMQFIVPNYTPLHIIQDPTASYIAASFEDGTVKLFDIKKGKLNGTAKISDCAITRIKFTQDGMSLIAGSCTGRTYVLSILKWEPVCLDVNEFVIAGGGVLSLDISLFEPTKTFLASTDNGRVSVWEKKLTAETLQRKI
jgi:WD40 repeat protein